MVKDSVRKKRKNRKKILSILAALALVCLFTACGNADTASTEAPVSGSPENAQTPCPTAGNTEDTQVVYPVTVTDQLGRQVTIEKEPESIASGYYISTSLLLALNLESKIVGVEAKAGSRAIYRLSAPSLPELPNIGSAKEFDLEACAALEPDLVIVPAKLKDTIPSLEALGLTVLAVNPENQELFEETAVLLGTATNTLTAANALLQYTDRQLETLANRLDGVQAPTVCLTSNSSFLAAAGSSMYQNSLIENAGGTNIAVDLTENYWTEISYEQLLAWNPEYIILAADAGYTVESVMEDPNLTECEAVRKGQVYQFPNAIEAWDSPIPGGVLGSLWLASVLHPEEFPADEWEKAVTEFYETFYRFTPDSELLQSLRYSGQNTF